MRKFNDGQKEAIKTIMLAYDDCAKFVDGLAEGAIAGMPSLSKTEQLLARLLLEQVAEAIRAKGRSAETHFSLALLREGSA
jgi:hypothetical protein